MTTRITIKNEEGSDIIVRSGPQDAEGNINLSTAGQILEPGEEATLHIWEDNVLVVEER